MKRLLLATLIAATSCTAVATEMLTQDTANQIQIGVDAYRNDKAVSLQYTDELIDNVNRSLTMLSRRTEENTLELVTLYDNLQTCGKEAKQWLNKTYSDDECNDFKAQHDLRLDEKDALANATRNTKALQLIVISGKSKLERQERQRVQEAREEQERAKQVAADEAKRAGIRLKREEARERNRVEAKARYDARVDELASIKSTMTQDEITQRVTTVRINSYAMCQQSSEYLRHEAINLRNQVNHHVSEDSYKYTQLGMNKTDAFKRAQNDYRHVYDSITEKFENARAITDKCLDDRIFWDF